jgi:uncharacterized protein (TIGR02466 family)
MTKSQFYNIFPVPFFSTFLDKSIVNDLEKRVIPKLHLLENLKGTKGSTQKTDYFEPNTVMNPLEFTEFFEAIHKNVLEFAEKSQLIVRSNNLKFWVQNYTAGDYHKRHCHPTHDISGVYYVQANEYAGEIVFDNPNPHIFTTPHLNTEIEQSKQFFKVKPQKGLLILFPSYLIHQVVSSDNKKCLRTCIAFNY